MSKFDSVKATVRTLQQCNASSDLIIEFLLESFETLERGYDQQLMISELALQDAESKLAKDGNYESPR